ncbi:MAG: nucleotidyl transferase AbiEii/AbiGii toxin family protein [Enterobacteriaceae bacterium]
MKVNPEDFGQLVAKAMQNAELSAIRPVIEKELLHYDILYCLDQARLLDNLVFQGGTSLRLCYGANRFSEDLDFAGGVNFSSAQLETIKTHLEEYIGQRYSIEVTVKKPATLKTEKHYSELKINKWQIAITTSPERRDIAKQRIKIEVANIPAYTQRALPLKNNYDFLPDGYEDVLIYTETVNEIMADKLVSLPATQKYIRHRDIWDLAWLQQQGAELDAELVKKKVADYQLTTFQQLLEYRIESIHDIVNSKEFYDEMKRFLPTNVYERTLGQQKFKSYLIDTLTDLLKKLYATLYQDDRTEQEFVL